MCFRDVAILGLFHGAKGDDVAADMYKACILQRCV